MDNHDPSRPTWLCRTCRQEWPCKPGRESLTAEFKDSRVALSIYMASRLHEAMRDLSTLRPGPEPSPAALHARFVAWVRDEIA